MYKFIAYIFTLMAAITSAGLIYLGHQYETVGHGLNPTVALLVIMILALCIGVMHAVSRDLDLEAAEEDFDLTNDIYFK